MRRDERQRQEQEARRSLRKLRYEGGLWPHFSRRREDARERELDAKVRPYAYMILVSLIVLVVVIFWVRIGF